MARGRMVWLLPVLVVAGGIAGLRTRAGSRPPDPASLRDPRVKQAVAVLLADDTSHSYELTRKRNEAIEDLKSIGTAEAAEALLIFLERPNWGEYTRHSKREALLALGQMGTRESIQALRRYDEWAESRRNPSAPFRFGYYDAPVWHVSGSTLTPEATATGKDRRQWAAFRTPDPLFQKDWWLTSSADGKDWRQPVWVGMPKKTLEGMRVLLRALASGERTLQEFEADGDRDGLSDSLEQRLGTDPGRADTNGDGTPDGRDGNPLTPRHCPDDTSEIRQAVFTAVFGVSNSRTSILVVGQGGHAGQEYYGYCGPVLKVPAVRTSFFNFTELSVTRTSATTAEARYADYEANQAASFGQVFLEKKQGRWVVVRFGPGGVA